jgi:hypothetical protein
MIGQNPIPKLPTNFQASWKNFLKKLSEVSMFWSKFFFPKFPKAAQFFFA